MALITLKPSLTLSLARHALTAAQQYAESNELKVSLWVVDAQGLPVHFAHLDGAPFLSQTIALHKALTAANFGRPTADWDERLRACSPGVQIGLPLQAGMALFGGGLPFVHQGTVLGAIGVSGASEAQDMACAAAAVQRVEALLQAD